MLKKYFSFLLREIPSAHVNSLFFTRCRTGIDKLEELMSTDMKQMWGRMKLTGYYKPKKIKDLCHVKAKPRLRLGSDTLQEIRQLIAAAPDSSLARHSRGRFDAEDKENVDMDVILEPQSEPFLIVEYMSIGKELQR